MVFNFDNTYTKLNSKLFTELKPNKIAKPELLILNEDLIKELNIENPKDLIQVLVGNKLEATSIAQAYAGHQFGHFTNLGDGRALLLGEHVTKNNQRFDIQLKGSGITPYSRGGDGKATTSSMLREYIYSITMENLKIKTSKSLAVISTNEEVFREGIEEGAILVRVMSSHIRIGTFEFVACLDSKKDLKNFTDYVIDRHYSNLSKLKEDKYIKFFEEVMNNLINTIIDWYRVGFIHGVMNTDNMSIIAETFDYGPCAFINHYNPKTKFSSVDVQGRYNFENQKDILHWNLARLAETLIPIVDDNQEIAVGKLNDVLAKYEITFENKFYGMMKLKLGIKDNNEHKDLINKFLDWLELSELDYTNTFIELLKPNSFDNKEFKSKEFEDLRNEIKKVGLNQEIMRENNPFFILRNYLVEEALEEYTTKKDLTKFNNLLQIMKNPYKDNSKFEEYKLPPKKGFDAVYKTFCNT